MDNRDLRFKALREPFDHVQKVKKEWVNRKGEHKSITLDYISHAVVTDRLLQVDPEYTFTPLLDNDGRPIVVLDGLAPGDVIGVWGRLEILGTSVVEFCGGTNLLDAYSRCLCRAAMRRGVALDLWIRDDEFKETRKEGGLGPASVPRSWAKVRELVETSSGQPDIWESRFEYFIKAASYHLYGETEGKKLTPDQRKVMLQKAAGAAVFCAEDDSNPLGPSWSVEHIRMGFAHVLDGALLEVPDLPEPEIEGQTAIDDEIERLADEAIVGPEMGAS
jgi:hypothetical protein